ncbi:MAG: class I SAM-dependent methyltransferase [Desulfatibacillum sp.]|nr:class I SAM-dependent methyltransferase [Desulfatibacillum sp.]
MYTQLEKINQRPKPFAYYTARDLWNDDYVSRKMLELHLNPDMDLASRKMEFVEMSAQWIASRFELGPGKSVCDFGCGPGLYTTRFSKTGARVTGLDFSRNSIAYAKQQALEQGLEIEYQLGNYLDFSAPGKFDLITMIYLDFCPLSPPQRQQLLDIFTNHLNDGGHVFMDVLTLRYFKQVTEERTYEYSRENGFWSPEPYYAFLNTWKYPETNLILGKHTLVEEHRTREIFNWLQCFSPKTLSRELGAKGFRILESYSDVAGTPCQEDGSEMAVVIQKV